MSDAELTELLGRAAAAAPAPKVGPPTPADEETADDDGSPTLARRSSHRRRWTRPLAAAAAIAVALAIGSQVLDDADSGDDGGPADTASGDDGDDGAGDGDNGAGDGAAPPPTFPASGVGAGSATAGGGGGGPATELGRPEVVESGGVARQAAQPRIIHTGTIGIEVGDGAFAGTIDQITSVVTGFGGFVAASETAEHDGDPSGTLTVRVPAAAFEPLVAEVRRLGEVQSVSTSGQDVTAQYVDLEARLGALRATRDQFLAVLAEARAIGDILAVQDRINLVNVEIESLEGQRRYLEDQSGFGTLQVTVAEPGARDRAEATESSGDGGIGGAWDEARRGFGDAIEWFVSRSGKGLVLALVAVAVLALGQLVLRRLRRRTI